MDDKEVAYLSCLRWQPVAQIKSLYFFRTRDWCLSHLTFTMVAPQNGWNLWNTCMDCSGNSNTPYQPIRERSKQATQTYLFTTGLRMRTNMNVVCNFVKYIFNLKKSSTHLGGFKFPRNHCGLQEFLIAMILQSVCCLVCGYTFSPDFRVNWDIIEVQLEEEPCSRDMLVLLQELSSWSSNYDSYRYFFTVGDLEHDL